MNNATPKPKPSPRLAAVFTVMTMVVITTNLFACDSLDVKTDDSRVLARINGRAISAKQVDHVIDTISAGTGSERTQQLVLAALEQLINEELLSQQALALQLDRTPEVKQSIVEKRRQILAASYLEHLGRDEPAHSNDDIRRFFNANSALFENRRIYQMHELVAAVPSDKRSQFEAVVEKASSLKQIAEWFRTHGYHYREAASTLAAERIPSELLEHLVDMKDADVTVLSAPDIVLVLQLIHAQDAPMHEKEATPLIKELLSAIRQKELASTAVKNLRQAARIEYLMETDAVPAPDETQEEPATPVWRKSPSPLVGRWPAKRNLHRAEQEGGGERGDHRLGAFQGGCFVKFLP